MKVVLQHNDQFGNEGPVAGDVLEIIQIRKIEDEYIAYASCRRVPGLYILPLDLVMKAKTAETETYWTT